MPRVVAVGKRNFEVRARFKTHTVGAWTHSEPLTWDQARRLAEALKLGGALEAEVHQSKAAKKLNKVLDAWAEADRARKKRSATG